MITLELTPNITNPQPCPNKDGDQEIFTVDANNGNEAIEKAGNQALQKYPDYLFIVRKVIFKQVDKTSVFAIPDDYIPNMKNFCGLERNVNSPWIYTE